jgi:heavy metal translocating P-type ATPase
MHPLTRLPPAARLPAAALAAIALGALARLTPGIAPAGTIIWMAGLVLTGAPVVWRTMRGIAAGRFAADLVAMLAVVTAVLLRQPLAGLIVVLMQTGGEALERYAEGRASDAVRELEAAAPRLAHLVLRGVVEDVSAERVVVGDTILIRPGELVPCDAVVLTGRSHVDESRLTGEPLPVSAGEGTRLMSGSLNGEGSLTACATAVSSQSQYARIVELVRSAQASKSPLQRLADRYAVWFTPVTLVVCAAAWALSGDPLRVLAVLVVATPCPLILATPVAIIGGINRAAKRQIIIRHGTALEQLASVRVGVFDKTGTLTIGRPRVKRVVPAPGFTEPEVLRLAGSVEQGASHLLARTLVEAAHERGVGLLEMHNVIEAPGRGVTGRVDGYEVSVGARAFIRERSPAADHSFGALEADGLAQDGGLLAYASANGRALGVVEYADELRPGAKRFFEELRALGLRRTMLLSGDRERYTRDVARAVGIDEVHAELLPEGKVHIVRRLVMDGEKVVMVGDGTNDAPALSAATVGIALAGHGGGITTEAAGVVILVDDLGRVVDAIRIAHATLRIARQSIWVGLGLSMVAMGFATAGLIPPTIGALLQEAIDVAVILNALRASAPVAAHAAGAPPPG